MKDKNICLKESRSKKVEKKLSKKIVGQRKRFTLERLSKEEFECLIKKFVRLSKRVN